MVSSTSNHSQHPSHCTRLRRRLVLLFVSHPRRRLRLVGIAAVTTLLVWSSVVLYFHRRIITAFPLWHPQIEVQVLEVLSSRHAADTSLADQQTRNHLDGKQNDKDRQHNEDDADCLFRNSSLVRKVYVYPSPGEAAWYSENPILSGKRTIQESDPHFLFPWTVIESQLKQPNGSEHYFPYSMTAQFSTELIVRDLMTRTCLQTTTHPEHAELFYIPYLPSLEFHQGVRGKPPSHATSPYSQALLDLIVHNDSAGWQHQFGYTDHYWHRRQGSDHILVFSEPLQGLTHPKGKRGHYHYIHTQRQLDAPIVLSVEVSKTFVQQYPACARKNILLPYPMLDGNQFNGKYDAQALQIWDQHETKLAVTTNRTLPPNTRHRPFVYWYKAGGHGPCLTLRQTLNQEYKHCSPRSFPLRNEWKVPYWIAMRLAQYCPCPTGDTPSAKRQMDAIAAGCVPVVVASDYVWPFSTAVGGPLNPDAFSVPSSQAFQWLNFHNSSSATTVSSNSNRTCCGLENQFMALTEHSSWQDGLQTAAHYYRYWEPSPTLPFNPLLQGILPNGGAAMELVRQLEERAQGRLWPECRDQVQAQQRMSALEESTEFVC